MHKKCHKLNKKNWTMNFYGSLVAPITRAQVFLFSRGNFNTYNI